MIQIQEIYNHAIKHTTAVYTYETVTLEEREKWFQTMVAGIDDQNIQSKLLHEKFGFRHMGTLEKVGYKFEQWLDLAFYQIQLK
nr:hypothetical protein [Staphylococcus coagulans]